MPTVATPTKAEIEAKALKAIVNARCQLMLGGTAATVFFAALALRLKLVPDWDCRTAWTDGKSIGYNPDFMLSLIKSDVDGRGNRTTNNKQLQGVIVHEVMHCVYGFFSRLQTREIRRFNVAHDLTINQIILNSKFELPEGCLLPGKPGPFEKFPADKSAEEYYNMLPQSPKGGKGKDGEPKEDEGGCGSVRKPGAKDGKGGSPSDIKEMEADWKQAVAAAHAMAKQKGALPSDLDRLCGEILAPVVDWREQLRKFVTQHAKSDYTWNRPNRRFVSAGMHLPSLYSEELGKIVVTVDTSGSVDNTMLGRFAGELNGILECMPCSVEIIYHHVDAYKVDSWKPEDGPLKLSCIKTGGTDHSWLRNTISEMPEQPVCCICLTDLYTSFGDAPDCPVLWAVVSDMVNAPFGEIIKVLL